MKRLAVLAIAILGIGFAYAQVTTPISPSGLPLSSGVPGVVQPASTDAASSTMLISPSVSNAQLFSAPGTIAISLSGYAGAGVFLSTSGFNGTIQYDTSYDNRTTWKATPAISATTGVLIPSTGETTFVGSTTTLARTIIVGAGVTDARVNVTTLGSGTVTATIIATLQSSAISPNIIVGMNRKTLLLETGSISTSTSRTTNPGILVRNIPQSSTTIGFSESVAAGTANRWYVKRQSSSTAPWGINCASSSVTTAGSRTLIGVGINLGFLDLSTNVFSTGSTVSSGKSYSRLIGVVGTAMSALADNLTVTYTNQNGTTGRTTGALTFAASSAAGDMYEFVLATDTGQALDPGVIAVTNMTDSAAPTGTVTVYGFNPIFESNGVANTLDVACGLNTGVESNESVFILLQQAAVTAQQRSATVTGFASN